MRKFRIYLLLVLILTIATMGCEQKLSTDQQKYSYVIGYQIGQNIKSQKIEVDANALKAAIEDVMSGKKSRLSQDDQKKVLMNMKKMMQDKMSKASGPVKKLGMEYLEKNKKKKGVIVTKSGLQYEVIKKGYGALPGLKDTVKVHYRGTLIDGKEFDSSYKRNKPIEFPVTGVIKGWTEGLQLMKTGSKYKLTIPSGLGYGDQGTRNIPGGSVLVFEVELLKVIKK
jgi:FKBP-type peptidyl-prolyl cis-trans isomerase